MSLEISSNYFGDIGASTLLTPLANLLNLKNISLNLAINSIGDTGA